MIKLHQGDCREVLATLPAESVQCAVTSPPYYGLRDYGCEGQIGLEQSPAEYVVQLVEVFREVRRVLHPTGVAFLNIGDSYAGSWGNQGRKDTRGTQRPINGEMLTPVHDGRYPAKASNTGKIAPGWGLKPKDLMLIPARVAISLQDDGWWIRSDIIWSKPNPMPESITDRPTKSHEYVFLLTKSERYFYDAKAIAEPLQTDPKENYPARAKITGRGTQGYTVAHNGSPSQDKSGGFPPSEDLTRNARSVWTIATTPYAEAHFATFPPALAERCIKAGSKPGDTVLDPFAGAGTTLLVADRLQRSAVGIELNPDYCNLIRKRLASDAPLLSDVA